MPEPKERPLDRAWRLQRKANNAWQRTLPKYRPKVYVTLKANKPMSEDALLRRVGEALHRLDQQKVNSTRPSRKPAYRRTAAFIFPENLGSNAHAHLLVWRPGKEGEDDTSLRAQIVRHRDRYLFVGYDRDYDLPHYADGESVRSPVFEKIWCSLVPGGQYHARFTDHRLRSAAGYSLKEHWKELDREPHFSSEFFSDAQVGLGDLQFCHPL